jgi:hypothetical protein
VFGRIGAPELMFVVILSSLMWLVVIWPASRICKRVGFSPWLGLLAIIPLANVVLLWVVAMSRWPSVQPDPNGPPVATT